MKSAFKFRLYPNHKQEQKLVRMIEATRHLWNGALARRKQRWEQNLLNTTYSQQCRTLTEERRDDPLLKELPAQAGQQILKRLDRAFEAFFKHKAGYPKFKKHLGSGSFTYPQACNGSARPDPVRKKLHLSKVGKVKAVFHRALPAQGLKTCTVVRESNGEWYSCLVYEDHDLGQILIPSRFQSPVGIDLGLKSLITTTDGAKVPHPRFLLKAETRLKRLQRRLSR